MQRPGLPFIPFWALFLLALQAHGQAPSDASFRVTVNLVQVDAVVTDSKGNHIRDLQAADFQIFEDGKPRKITDFSWIDGNSNPQASNRVASLPHSLRKEDIRRSIVLMVDDSGRHTEEDLLPLMASVKKFVAEQLGPGDLAAVTASRGGMGFYQQFTSDKQQLYAAVDRLAHRPGFGMWTLDIPVIRDPEFGELEPMFTLAPAEPGLGYRNGSDAPMPVAYLTWAIQGLQKYPGARRWSCSHTPLPPPASDRLGESRRGCDLRDRFTRFRRRRAFHRSLPSISPTDWGTLPAQRAR